MSSWFDRGRPLIFQALTSICDQIDRELTEGETQTEALSDTALIVAELRHHVHADVIRPPESTEPRASRRSELERARSDLDTSIERTVQSAFGQPVSTSESASGDIAPHRLDAGPSVSEEPIKHESRATLDVSTNLHEGEANWNAEYAKLNVKFKLLSDNFKKARDALQKRKDERDKWFEHAKSLEKKIKTAEEEHGIRILERNVKTPAQDRKRPPAARETSPMDAPVKVELETANILPDAINYNNAAASEATAAADAETRSTQRSTQSGSEGAELDLPHLSDIVSTEEPRAEHHPSSDKVEFLRERSTRKRRRADSPSGQLANPRIKTEPVADSSSPLLFLHQCDFIPQESIDLGESGPLMPTPRKRRLLEDPDQDRPLPNATASNVSGPFPAPVNSKPQMLADQAMRVGPNVGGGSMSFPSDSPMVARKQRFEKDLSRGIAFLAEDGIPYSTDNAAGALPTPTSLVPASKSRLDTLLNSPSPANWDTISRPRRQIHRQNVDEGRLQEELAIPRPRELPFDKTVRQSAKRTNGQSFKSPRTPLADTSANVPRGKHHQSLQKVGTSLLRNKALSDLRLEDFKINPLANDGQDFAYSDVVRDKEERSCLPGCVDMHCCGKQFRALALSQRPDPPLTTAQRLEEQTLLENHLGDEAYRLVTMAKEERAELWVEAKTQELANKYGKHRHRFSRMRSPPGFWNADFPSTQELEANKVESAQRQKKTIQERYREAMRPGGRWIFRDE